MNLFELSHKNPVATAIMFVILVILGVVGLFNMPVQLTPDIERPQITIINAWSAAAPAEMESQIVEPQEGVLRTIPGVREIRSSVRAGLALTTIEFELNQDMQKAFIGTVNALNQAPPIPREAMEPHIIPGGMSENVATLLLMETDEAGDGDFTRHQDLIEFYLQPKLRQIPGIANVDLNSMRAKELQIRFDPYQMAALGITLEQVMSAIQRSGDMSGGFASVGRREYTVRFEGQYTPQTYGDMIVSFNEGRPVFLKEVAKVGVGFADSRSLAFRNGNPAFFITMQRSYDSNTVDIMEHLVRVIDEANEEVLRDAGLELALSFDASIHIKRAISLVKSSLTLGILLAMGLLYFLVRGWKSTLLIGLTIPVSLAGAIFVLALLDRTLNIISLAGVAFAVGLVLDAAIVVQENFIRIRNGELNSRAAALKATREVAPALFASTFTTVAIFAPILIMKGVEGQLFYDLAVSISVAVITSLLCALFLLPVISAVWLCSAKHGGGEDIAWHRITPFYGKVTSTRGKSLFWTLLLFPGAILLIVLSLPRPDFLPDAKWEGVMTVFDIPPGASMEVLEEEIGQTIVKRMKPYLEGTKTPAIADYNIGMSAGGNLLFIYPEDPKQTESVIELVRSEILVDLPDTRAFAFQASLLSMQPGGGRTLYVNFTGEIDPASRLVYERLVERIKDELPGAQVRHLPGLVDAQPELRIRARNHELAMAGVDRMSIALLSRALTSGMYSGEYFSGHERMNIMVSSTPWQSPEELQAMPVYTSGSGVQALGQLAIIERTTGPTQLRRLDGKRTITLAVTPPANVSLDEAVETLNLLIAEARPQVSAGVHIEQSGGSDDLASTISSMSSNFLLATLILFLILTALFRSATDSILVLSSMPLALAGGVLGLHTLNLFTFQALDLLTMIGFIILLGLVVNNAILLVDQTRRAEQRGMKIDDAVHYAIQTRIRPVFMSTLTSVVGMLPLAVIPGVGSEIYRGLAVVIVGGMVMSALFTLIYIPAALKVTSRSRGFSVVNLVSQGEQQ